MLVQTAREGTLYRLAAVTERRSPDVLCGDVAVRVVRQTQRAPGAFRTGFRLSHRRRPHMDLVQRLRRRKRTRSRVLNWRAGARCHQSREPGGSYLPQLREALRETYQNPARSEVRHVRAANSFRRRHSGCVLSATSSDKAFAAGSSARWARLTARDRRLRSSRAVRVDISDIDVWRTVKAASGKWSGAGMAEMTTPLGDRKFDDSPVEGSGFELAVRAKKGGSDIIDQAPMARRTVDGGHRQGSLSRARRRNSQRGRLLCRSQARSWSGSIYPRSRCRR